jgi:hypothetical protein
VPAWGFCCATCYARARPCVSACTFSGARSCTCLPFLRGGARLAAFTMEDLAPGREYHVRAQVEGMATLDFRFETPGAARRRVNILSCTEVEAAADAPETCAHVAALPRTAAVNLHIGDQVYADGEPLDIHELYVATWLRVPAMRALLASGANVFLPDDHEVHDSFVPPASTPVQHACMRAIREYQMALRLVAPPPDGPFHATVELGGGARALLFDGRYAIGRRGLQGAAEWLVAQGPCRPRDLFATQTLGLIRPPSHTAFASLLVEDFSWSVAHPEQLPHTEALLELLLAQRMVLVGGDTHACHRFAFYHHNAAVPVIVVSGAMKAGRGPLFDALFREHRHTVDTPLTGSWRMRFGPTLGPGCASLDPSASTVRFVFAQSPPVRLSMDAKAQEHSTNSSRSNPRACA